MGGSPRRAKPAPRVEETPPETARQEVAKTTAPSLSKDPSIKRTRSRTRGGLTLSFTAVDDEQGNARVSGSLGGIRNPLGGDRR
jgi:hypothetical protein